MHGGNRVERDQFRCSGSRLEACQTVKTSTRLPDGQHRERCDTTCERGPGADPSSPADRRIRSPGIGGGFRLPGGSHLRGDQRPRVGGGQMGDDREDIGYRVLGPDEFIFHDLIRALASSWGNEAAVGNGIAAPTHGGEDGDHRRRCPPSLHPRASDPTDSRTSAFADIRHLRTEPQAHPRLCRPNSIHTRTVFGPSRQAN